MNDTSFYEREITPGRIAPAGSAGSTAPGAGPGGGGQNEPAAGPGSLVDIVESEVDLYYRIAVEMYRAVAENNRAERDTVFIVPVGPTFQYRRFVYLCAQLPIDLSRLHLFFMDEYIAPSTARAGSVTDAPALIPLDSPLSFRGFVVRELVEPLLELDSAAPGVSRAVGRRLNFSPDHVYFPDPADPAAYDRRLEELGGADICFAGVGINGHLAFNEPPMGGENWPEDGAGGVGANGPAAAGGAGGSDAAVASAEASRDENFFSLGTRIVELTRETITINSNTALGGAWEQIPRQAITVGMKQILASRSLRIFLNRPWQRAVVRKLLYGPVTGSFPASAAQLHPDPRITMTAEVAAPPQFALR